MNYLSVSHVYSLILSHAMYWRFVVQLHVSGKQLLKKIESISKNNEDYLW